MVFYLRLFAFSKYTIYSKLRSIVFNRILSGLLMRVFFLRETSIVKAVFMNYA